MVIKLNDIGKKYNKHWIFRHVTLSFESGKTYAITGNNGSGKSTLMQTIAGFISPNQGEVSYEGIEKDEVNEQIVYSAPYLDLIEEMTLPESLDFHQSFKPFIPGASIESISSLLGFASGKLIKEYSSGMQQRLKLVLAFFSDVSVILLDEPTANLDQQGVEWYLQLIKEYQGERTIVIASNDEREYAFCDQIINILDYK